MKPVHYRSRRAHIRASIRVLQEQRQFLIALSQEWRQAFRDEIDFDRARKVEIDLPALHRDTCDRWGDWGDAWAIWQTVEPRPSRIGQLLSILDTHIAAGQNLLR